MDKTTTENKLARNVETKTTAANCPAKGEHPSFLGRVHPPCGELIPIGAIYTPAEFKRLFEVDMPASVGTDAFAEEEARLWDEYQAVDDERARLSGAILRADKELITLKAEVSNAEYKRGTGDPAEVAAVSRRITQNGEQRVQLREELDAVMQRERVIQLKITKVGQRREAERRRLEAVPPARPGLIERAASALRR